LLLLTMTCRKKSFGGGKPDKFVPVPTWTVSAFTRTWETEPLAGVYTRWSGFTESVWPSTSCGSLELLTSQNTIPRARAAPAKAAMTLGVVW
jgi:hypothetical protein